MKLLTLIKDIYQYLRGPEIPSEPMREMFDLLITSTAVDISYVGGPKALILVHGIGDGTTWNEFKIKHRGTFVMEVCNEVLYPHHSNIPTKVGFSFYLHANTLSKADIKFLGALATSQKVEETNFLPYDENPRLKNTDCKYIKKFSISGAALYCVVCK